jgi:hypothetical protein
MTTKEFLVWCEIQEPIWEQWRKECEKAEDRYYAELGNEIEQHPLGLGR